MSTHHTRFIVAYPGLRKRCLFSPHAACAAGVCEMRRVRTERLFLIPEILQRLPLLRKQPCWRACRREQAQAAGEDAAGDRCAAVQFAVEVKRLRRLRADGDVPPAQAVDVGAAGVRPLRNGEAVQRHMRGKAAPQHPHFQFAVVQRPPRVEVEQPAGKDAAVADGDGHKVTLNRIAVHLDARVQAPEGQKRPGGLGNVARHAKALEGG